MVEQLSVAPSAFVSPDGKEEPLCTVLELPPALMSGSQDPNKGAAHRAFLDLVRSHLAKGRPIVVKGWMPELCINFNIDDIGIIRPTLDQTVQYQGK
jgi:hypothetical protein